MTGSYTHFRDLEITNSAPERHAVRGHGMYIVGHHNRIINLVVHDVGVGIGFWSTSVPDDSEIYGTVLFNIDWEGEDRGHGHSIYMQNNTGVKKLRDNIAFHSFSFGFQAYTQDGQINNLEYEGNLGFNHGTLSARSGYKANYLLDGRQRGRDAVYRENYSYYPEGSSGRATEIGYVVSCVNAIVEDNYFVGGSSSIVDCGSLVMSANTISHPTPSSLPVDYPSNVYYTGRPSGLHVAVRPNMYEEGRSNIYIFNWDHHPEVSVDLTGTGLNIGDAFEIRDVQNYWVPVVSGVYEGGTVSIPMTGLAIAPPVGNVPIVPEHTGPELGAFIVKRANTAPVSATQGNADK